MSPLNFSQPQLVGTIMTQDGLAKLAKPPRGIDLIEVRTDALLQEGVIAAELAHALRRRKIPVLLTCRAANEGGFYPWEKGERSGVLHQLLPYVEAIDIELASVAELKAELAAARHLKRKLILSVHSLQKPAAPAALRRWAAALRRAKPDVAKIAAKIETRPDLQALAALLLEESRHAGPRWALMGTGPQAAPSRQVLTALGSALLYGYLDRPAAPGQPSAASLLATRDAFG